MPEASQHTSSAALVVSHSPCVCGVVVVVGGGGGGGGSVQYWEVLAAK